MSIIKWFLGKTFWGDRCKLSYFFCNNKIQIKKFILNLKYIFKLVFIFILKIHLARIVFLHIMHINSLFHRTELHRSPIINTAFKHFSRTTNLLQSLQSLILLDFMHIAIVTTGRIMGKTKSMKGILNYESLKVTNDKRKISFWEFIHAKYTLFFP